jgi:hypothetical protein
MSHKDCLGLSDLWGIIGSRHQGLPVPRPLVKRVKGMLGEIRRSIAGTVIDIDQFKQTNRRMNFIFMIS